MYSRIEPDSQLINYLITKKLLLKKKNVKNFNKVKYYHSFNKLTIKIRFKITLLSLTKYKINLGGIQIGVLKLVQKIITPQIFGRGDNSECARFDGEIPPFTQISLAASVVACNDTSK